MAGSQVQYLPLGVRRNNGGFATGGGDPFAENALAAKQFEDQSRNRAAGGTTWAPMGQVQDGQFFKGPSAGSGGPMTGGPTIHGYNKSGIPTNQFQDAFGRAPTAQDYYNEFGGLSPAHPQMGSLDAYYRSLLTPMRGFNNMTGGSYVKGGAKLTAGVPYSPPATQVAGQAVYGNNYDEMSHIGEVKGEDGKFRFAGNSSGLPYTSSFAYYDKEGRAEAAKQQAQMEADISGIAKRRRPSLFKAADGGVVPAGNPVLVGERGPEVVLPKEDIVVVPNEMLHPSSYQGSSVGEPPSPYRRAHDMWMMQKLREKAAAKITGDRPDIPLEPQGSWDRAMARTSPGPNYPDNPAEVFNPDINPDAKRQQEQAALENAMLAKQAYDIARRRRPSLLAGNVKDYLKSLYGY